MFAYDFQTNRIPGEPADAAPYWRDVGTIDAYYEANMDLRSVSPALNLYNREWPLRSTSYPDPPAKFTFDDDNRRGQAIDSIVSGGCILSGGVVRNSVLGRGVRVHAGALVEDCVILDNCDIGRRAKIRRAHPRQERQGARRCDDRLRPGGGPRARLSRHRERHRGGRRRAQPRRDHAASWCKWNNRSSPGSRSTDTWRFSPCWCSASSDCRCPDETLLTFTGYLVYKGHLSLPLAFLSGFAGSVCGITISYILGRTFGLELIHRYGRYLRITEEHVEKAHAWFERVGHWGLTFGYFIPGVRHFTAYAAGMSDLESPHIRALRL